MKIIVNKYKWLPIPFTGYNAINLFGAIITRPGVTISERTIRHEKIHTAQMKELWYIPFYLMYFFEWFGKLFMYGSFHKAYRNISFEREAYTNQNDVSYLVTRKKYAWMRYLKKQEL